MGKPKLCSNPFHDEWNSVEKKDIEKVKVLKHKYLVFIKKLAKERGFVSHKIRSVCLECQDAIEKRVDTQSTQQCVLSADQVVVGIIFLISLLLYIYLNKACTIELFF